MTKPLPRIRDYQKTLPIIELYPCLQGEGSRRGNPSFAIRTTGCTHRCYFGEHGGWCDTWYSSIHAIKGKFSFNNVLALLKQFPQVKEIMLTGGAPSMQPAIINELSHIANEQGLFITLETEGSHFIKTDYPLGLISLSPKLSNSIPKLGVKTPQGKQVDQAFIDQHNKYRLNFTAMQSMIHFHHDYQLKIVSDSSSHNIKEIKTIQQRLNIPNHKVYLMPAGVTQDEMIKQYPIVMEAALKEGFCFSGRDHIIAYDDKIGV